MKFFRLTRYLLEEMLAPFILGVFVFIFILLMFQALRLTEFVLIHGVDYRVILKIAGYLTISFLPAILPMSLLFAIINCYGRLSSDAEIVAFKAIGVNILYLYLPALILASLVSLVAAKTSFELAPWGNRQFELLITKVGSSKVGVALKDGIFVEGFFDLVLYANKVDSKNGYLQDVFIYDERKADLPLTIIAKEGFLVQAQDQTSQEASLKLVKGNIHRQTDSYVRVNFETYEIHLSTPIQTVYGQKSAQSLTLQEIKQFLKNEKIDHPDHLMIESEFYKRWAIALAALFFALVGVGLSITANRRQKSGGLALSLGLIVLYWILYVAGDNLARSHLLAPSLAVWLGNLLYLGAGLLLLKKAWR